MRKFLAPFVATAAAAMVLTACSKTEGPPQMPPPQVSVATPLRQSVVDWDDFTGRFEAPERVDVRARAGGYLQSANFSTCIYHRKPDHRAVQRALAGTPILMRIQLPVFTTIF